jgi:hypothetical protein
MGDIHMNVFIEAPYQVEFVVVTYRLRSRELFGLSERSFSQSFYF